MIVNLILAIFFILIVYLLFKNVTEKSNTTQRHFVLLIILNVLLYWYIQFEFDFNSSKILILLFIIIPIIYFISKLPRTQKMHILLINVCFLIICLSMFIVDFSRVQNQQAPIFYYTSTTFQDGGTIAYYSLGYTVYKFHNLVGYETFEPIYICTFRESYSEVLNKIFK